MTDLREPIAECRKKGKNISHIEDQEDAQMPSVKDTLLRPKRWDSTRAMRSSL